MKTLLKRIVVAAGLLTASSLLAYGPGFGGPGYFGHQGPMHNGYGGHMMGGGYGPGFFQGGDIEKRLEKTKSELAITPEQEAVWKSYAATLKTHSDTAKAIHQAMWSLRGTGPRQERYQLHQGMWQQRQAVHQAATKLIDSLDEQQRQKAVNVIGYNSRVPCIR